MAHDYATEVADLSYEQARDQLADTGTPRTGGSNA
jgi:hypothetical protein